MALVWSVDGRLGPLYDMHRTLLGILLLAACVAVTAPAAAQRTIEVVYDDGRARDEMAVYRLGQDGRAWFLRANDVARLFKATQFWNASSRKVVLGVGRSRFVLTVDTRVVVIDGEPVMMRTPTRYDAGFVMVPLEFILEVASYYTSRTFLWDEDDMTLLVQGVGYNVEKIELAAEKDRTTATIDLTEPLLYHMDTSTPGIVRLKLYGGRIEARAFTIRGARGLVEGVRAEQTERDAFIYFDVSRQTKRLRVERSEEPQQLVVILEKGDLPEIPEPDFEGTVQIVDDTAAERRTFEIETVVIDPGHGGVDLGKVGATGLLEKEVNLELALAMKRRIEEELGLEVILTRESDELLALRRRTEIANEAGGDLFISVHCNSWFSEQTGGFEAYFLSPARSESERALARYENTAGEVNPGATAVEAGGDVDFILWDLVQNQFINESSTFAEFIQKTMEDRLAIRNRGVKQANFVVLQGAKMPAVLIETAFLSNPAEERLLADADFHRSVSEGIVEAIGRLRERYRR
jgi:N-acetylmuramoyl-L-alanine amidase